MIGIDYGNRRVGVALSSEGDAFALPHAVFENNKFLIDTIVSLCKHKGVSGIVIGESVDFRGKPNPVMKNIRFFVDKLKEKLPNTPIFFEKETLTTQEAKRIQGKHKNIDASSAALILEGYLSRKRHH